VVSDYFKDIENFETNILNEVEEFLNKAEMAKVQRNFLNGIIRKTKPKKLLEVGVSAGGSTINMLNAIRDIEGAILYSIDYNSQWYRDKNKKTGWCVKEYTPELMNKWQLYTGGVTAKFIEQIGKGIDLCLLDTVHNCPGELLDILMILPFMKKDGIIVLHDINFHHGGNDKNGDSNGTLFAVLRADKFYPDNDSKPIANIGAFKLNDDTFKYVNDIFLALNLSWTYKPNQNDIECFMRLFQKYYSQNDILLLDKIIYWNIAKFTRIECDIKNKEIQNKEIQNRENKNKEINKKNQKKRKTYPKFFIYFLCWFIPKKKNRTMLRAKYIKQ
jgi:predicted O-methyltransferase YrrM